MGDPPPPQGWRHWKEYAKPNGDGYESGEIGRGCE